MEDEFIGTVGDKRLIAIVDFKEIWIFYESKYKDDAKKLSLWYHMTTSWFKYMKDWFNPYHNTHVRDPDISEMDREFSSHYQMKLHQVWRKWIMVHKPNETNM